jgi:transcriptional regulator with XRE-family HTH domain
MTLGTLLKAWRKSEDISTQEAAKRIGLGAMTYNRIERGKPCNMDALATILIWMIR